MRRQIVAALLFKVWAYMEQPQPTPDKPNDPPVEGGEDE